MLVVWKCLGWIVGIAFLTVTSGCAVVAVQAVGAVPMLVKDIAIMSEKQPDLRRNDRQLNYEIEVLTADYDKIMFAGSSDCPSNDSSKDKSPIYETVQPYSESLKDGRRWLLSGISCDDAIRNTAGTKYKLYEVVSDKSAKLHLFQGDRSAKIHNAKFTSSPHRAASTIGKKFNAYPEGPYSYQKIIFNAPLSSVRSDTLSPTVLCHDDSGSHGCLSDNESFTRIDKREFSYEVLKRQSIREVEEGFLAYQPATNSWATSSKRASAPPFDVASETGISETAPVSERYQRLFRLRIQLDGRYYSVSKYGHPALLYVPKENSILLIRPFVMDRPSSSGWVACEPSVCQRKIEWLVLP